MRTLLGALRHGDDEVELAPSPTLADLGRLAEDVGNAGLAVEIHVEGDPVVLPSALEMTAYRVVQEGLTNTLKHARATSAPWSPCGYLPTELALEVRDDGTGPATGADTGYGLVGIGERVKIFGGRLTSGPSDGGGFALGVSLPLARAS